jgi:hypothetical protein
MGKSHHHGKRSYVQRWWKRYRRNLERKRLLSD